MKRALTAGLVGVLMLTVWAFLSTPNRGASACAFDMALSREISAPPITDRASYELWTYAANYSPLQWQVAVVDGHICASPAASDEHPSAERPPFEPEADEFRGGSRFASFARVDDGWLVGFNLGEFGAALYWFSPDGQSHYRMSENQVDKQVVVFFPLGKNLGAIEGLDHLGISEGSIIRIVRLRHRAAGKSRPSSACLLPPPPPL